MRATKLIILACVGGSDAFISPQIWSRIRSSLSLYSSRDESHRVGHLESSRQPRNFAERLLRLKATASFGSFGDDAFSYAELRDQLSNLESQLAGAMEFGRYDEAKQLVSEITSFKDFMEKQAGSGYRNPFAEAFGLPTASHAAVTALPPNGGLETLTPPRRRRSAFSGPLGSGVFGRRRNGKTTGLGREGTSSWPQARRSGDVPMEAVRKRHSDITAYGIRVEVFCFFQPGASRPQDNLYQFQCNIRITNTNPGDVQLLSRELKIYKADGSPPEYGPASQQLESQPTVSPGSVYMYMSEFGITCIPEDKKYLGRIEGHFNVAVKDEDAVVKVPIAPFWLEIPGDTLVLV